MTEELEKKAKERANSFLIDLCAYCRECEKKECSHTKDAIFGYKEGYKKGYEQGQKDNCETHKDCQFLKYFEKENEQLKATITKMRIAIAEKNSEVEELKAKLSSVYNCLYCGCSNCNFENCTTKRS